MILAAIIAICWRGIDEFAIFAPLTTGAIRYDIPTRLAVTATGHYPVVAASPWRVAGEIAIAIPPHVRLVMVANDLPALTDPLVSDVLRALTVSPDQVLQLTPEKIAMLPQGSRCNSWRLGTDEPLSLEGAQVASPLTELRANPTARAALWQQICTYEHDFFPRND